MLGDGTRTNRRVEPGIRRGPHFPENAVAQSSGEAFYSRRHHDRVPCDPAIRYTKRVSQARHIASNGHGIQHSREVVRQTLTSSPHAPLIHDA